MQGMFLQTDYQQGKKKDQGLLDKLMTVSSVLRSTSMQAEANDTYVHNYWLEQNI